MVYFSGSQSGAHARTPGDDGAAQTFSLIKNNIQTEVMYFSQSNLDMYVSILYKQHNANVNMK